MKIVISPAKTLDYETPLPVQDYTLPVFTKETAKLNTALRKKSSKKLSGLMSISTALADLNYECNQCREPACTPDNARQAIFAFKGDVYLGIDAYSLSTHQVSQLQEKLRILSGLYGLLKPLDLMQPYRLEMGTKLKVGKKDNLYKFWDRKITDTLNEELKTDEPLINLASQEYFNAIKADVLKVPVITPVFKDFVNGQSKVVSFHAKRARGMMVRYIIDKHLDNVDDLKTFNYGNYAFDDQQSTEQQLVFIR